VTFTINWAGLNNFRSYKGSHRLELPSKRGLYFFGGVNKAQDLGANGAGKSTFLDAIVWCLYGQTSRGLRASDVLTWGVSSGCSVEVSLTIGESEHLVKRTQKPNSLLLDGKLVDQPELEKTLRLNCRAFLCSVLNAQFGESFFNMSPTVKLTLFSDIMNLDYWLELSDLAKKRSNELLGQIDLLTRKVEKQEGQIKSIEEDMAFLKQSVASFKEEKQARIDTAYKKANDLEEKCEILESQSLSLDKEIEKAEMRLSSQHVVVSNHETRVDSFLAQIQKTSDKRKECEMLVRQNQAAIKELSNDDDRCPVCRQKMHKAIRQSEIDRFTYDAEVEGDEAKMHASVVIKLTEEMLLAKSDLESASAKLRAGEREIDKMKQKYTRLKAELKMNLRLADDAAEKLCEAQDQENPYTTILDNKRGQLKKLESDSIKDLTQLADLEAAQAASYYWVKGFKRIRLYVIEKAFRTLEVEVNNSLAQLGMTDWQVTFDVERENKSGGTTKGFITLIQGPSNKVPVRWESWSGGETQRLQLAGDLGLANLIMEQAGLVSSVEFYDEPSTHLSPEGMLDLADMLHERAVTEGKTIWIIDHASITNFGDFEGVIEARKDHDGSTIGYRK
jgi:DNA repair exonuclease SbcCD ATPase subunit